MTTIKSILNWLFGVYKNSFALQMMLIVVIGLHVGVALTAYVLWLSHHILRMFA